MSRVFRIIGSPDDILAPPVCREHKVEEHLMDTNEQAMDIAQSVVTETGLALTSGDFRKMLRYQSLPLTIETFDGRILIKTIEEARNVFDSVRAYLCRQGVTRSVRHVSEAKFVNDHQIDVVYQSDVYCGDELLSPANQSFLVLGRFEERWRIVYAMYSALGNRHLNRALMNLDGPAPRVDTPDDPAPLQSAG
jgi:hypothetical protein